ncbi:MAG: OmpW/AlkL family protein [Rhodoferax sp.]
MKHPIRTLVMSAACALTVSAPALAQTTTIKAGWAGIDPNSAASSISGPFTPTDALSLSVKRQSTLFFSVSREIDSDWDVELALGAPPTHDVTVVVLNPALVTPTVGAADGQVAATVRQIAPTLFANYWLSPKDSAVRPFVGVGVNYTSFDNASSTAVNNTVNGGPTSIKLSDSVGLALQLGVSVKLDGPWSLNAAWSTAQVKTKMTTNTLGIERSADVSFKPSVLSLSVGYSF